LAANDSTARAAATHAGLTDQGFSVCSGRLRPHSIERRVCRWPRPICPPIPTHCGLLPWPARANWRRRPPSCKRQSSPFSCVLWKSRSSNSRSPSCGGCNSAALRSDWPGTSSSSNCGSRSWKPAKPKRSPRLPPKTGRCRSVSGTGQSVSRCQTICRVRRACTSQSTTAPAPVRPAAATWLGLVKTSPRSSTMSRAGSE